MKEFTTEQLQEQFEKLPKDLQDAVSSTQIHDSIVAIGKKYGLHVDQLGQMVDLVGLIMLGLSPSKDFVNNFSQESGVKTDIATSIAEDINKEVFGKIRASMQKIEVESDKVKQSVSDLERAGGFSIEPSLAAPNVGGAAPTNLPGAEEITESKEDLISGIENPQPAQPRGAQPEENHTDIIVDNLLAGPVVAVEKKTEQPALVPQTPKKPSGPDLYREPIQ